MNLAQLGSEIHNNLVEELNRIKSRYGSEFPYFIQNKIWSGDHFSSNYDNSPSYMIGLSLDKDGIKQVSKVHYRLIPNTYEGRVMIEAQFRKTHFAEANSYKRKSKHEFMFSDREDWKYDKVFVIEANVITIMMLLGMNISDCYDEIVKEVMNG